MKYSAMFYGLLLLYFWGVFWYFRHLTDAIFCRCRIGIQNEFFAQICQKNKTYSTGFFNNPFMVFFCYFRSLTEKRPVFSQERKYRIKTQGWVNGVKMFILTSDDLIANTIKFSFVGLMYLEWFSDFINYIILIHYNKLI